MSEFKACPHGYDIACLICGFGTENGKRVDRRKPIGNRIDQTSVKPIADMGDDFPIENHISPNCQSRDV